MKKKYLYTLFVCNEQKKLEFTKEIKNCEKSPGSNDCLYIF